MQIDAIPGWRTKRKILGMSAILLPVTAAGEVVWKELRDHVARTLESGLIPAVNMDTGYAHLIDESTRVRVLRETQQVCGSAMYVAGAFVGDEPDADFDFERYAAQMESIASHGGTPVVFQSFGLRNLDDSSTVEAYVRLASVVDRFIAFELGEVFAPFGKIYSLDVYEQLLRIPACMGAKHSSLDRHLEWERIALRDRIRPDFHVLTGNDLAIDMVMYGSDYLLGLSTFAPDLFALRDRMWEAGDAEFFHLNDWLQYLGFFTFRRPVPAYKHSAAQFLKLRGWITSDATFPGSPQRPPSDLQVLEHILAHFRETGWIDAASGMGK
ncbi:MAG: dihydrodipicolinate synthase family protein [Planctomycetota bacterium]|nr:MAG: dihydrodipicolinate synthase family protein [Planctomycetota bacterium]